MLSFHTKNDAKLLNQQFWSVQWLDTVHPFF